ncbi:MAG: hypothetical protein ACXADC_09220 [Candidatus Thorarchaeota archaeon]
MPDIDTPDSSEQVFAREECDFYDESNRKVKGKLVVTQRRLVFMKKHQPHHAIDIELIRGLYMESAGVIGAYLRIDFDSPNGISIARYRGSKVKAQHLMDHIKASMSSLGVIRTYETPNVTDSFGESMELLQYSRPVIDSPTGPYDVICECGLFCMWTEVVVIATSLPYIVWSGWIVLLPIGFIALTMVLSLWWVVSKKKEN